MQVSLAGRIRNINLPDSKVLLPLFEAVVNSIHAIEDAGINDGFIKIFVERDNIQTGLIDGLNFSKIESFKIVDNGIGFDNRNYQSFMTSDSTWKISRGSKGIGRFLWLKVFTNISITSIYKSEDKFLKRTFDFNVDGGVSNTVIKDVSDSNPQCETVVRLINLNSSYINKCPQKADNIAKKILEHCISYFLLASAPSIEVIDGEKCININNYFETNLQPNSEQYDIELAEQKFHIKSLRFYGSDNSEHKLCYCANNREVYSENLDKYIVDLVKNKKLKDENDKLFTYLAYLSSPYLDNRVNSERIKFNIPEVPDDFAIEELRDISMNEIRNASLSIINDELSSLLESVKEDKQKEIREFIVKEAPEYRPLLKYAAESLAQIRPGLSTDKLDIELHKLQSQFELSLKEKGREILQSPIEDFEQYPDYNHKYHEFLEQYNDFGKSKLAEYVVHRKVILDIFGKNLKKDDGGKYKLERDVHEIVFPLRSTSEDVEFEKQNLWIIDEKLTYHHYLASDKPLNSLKDISIESDERPDLLIFNNPIAFVEGEEQPYSSVVIVEFKRPMRDNYRDEDNPISQVYDYVRKIQSGRFTDKGGRLVDLPKETPFYAYIICDITLKIKEFAENATFYQTPDLQGYFGYNTRLHTYVEILSFTKLITDAKKRNSILFKKLNL